MTPAVVGALFFMAGHADDLVWRGAWGVAALLVVVYLALWVRDLIVGWRAQYLLQAAIPIDGAVALQWYAARGDDPDLSVLGLLVLLAIWMWLSGMAMW
jgi:hypothetical protein